MTKKMKMITVAVLTVLAACIFAGCAKKVNFSDLVVGMEKNSVVSLMGGKYETKASPERLIYTGIRFADMTAPSGDTKVVFFLNGKEQVYAVCYYMYGEKDAGYKKVLEDMTAKYGTPTESEADNALWSKEGYSVALTKTDEYVGISLF